MQAVFIQIYWMVGSKNNRNLGILTSIPNTDNPKTPADYTPIIWLNTEYKILVLIRANRIKPTLSDMLHPIQYFGVSCNTIFDAVSTL